jgi:predicted transcriptional regulator
VTAAEMLRLREHPYCMSNAQIAKQLDISYQTVLKYIGKQNAGETPKVTEAQTTSKRIFDRAQSLTRLVAGERTWLVDVYNQCVESEQPLKFLTSEAIHSLINELTYFDQLLQRAREEGKTKCL